MGWFKEDDVQEMVWEENFTIIKQSIRGGGEYNIIIFAQWPKEWNFLESNTEKNRIIKDQLMSWTSWLTPGIVWYEDILCKPGVEGVKELKKILNDEDGKICALALKMVSFSLWMVNNNNTQV